MMIIILINSDVLKQFSGKHKYTNDEALKQRCFQVYYEYITLTSRLHISLPC